MEASPEERTRLSRVAERRANRPASIDPHQWYSIDETAAALDKSRAGVNNDIAAGRIRSTKDGKRRKIQGAEIIRVSDLLAEQAA